MRPAPLGITEKSIKRILRAILLAATRSESFLCASGASACCPGHRGRIRRKPRRQSNTDGTRRQLAPIALLDHVREVDPLPAHHAMLGHIGSVANQIRYRRLLRGGERRLRPRRGSIVQPSRSITSIQSTESPTSQEFNAAGITAPCIPPQRWDSALRKGPAQRADRAR